MAKISKTEGKSSPDKKFFTYDELRRMYNIDPEVPFPEFIPTLDKAALLEWANEDRDYDKQYSNDKLKIVKNIEHVSFQDFLFELFRVVEKANKLLEDDKFVVLHDGEPHKSRRWVYHLVKNKLKRAKYAGLFDSYGRTKWNDSIVSAIVNDQIDTFAIVDDAAFTGLQLMQTIKFVTKLFRHYRPSATLKIVIVCPYISDEVKLLSMNLGEDIPNMLEDDDSNRTIRIVSQKRMKRVKQILGNERVEQMTTKEEYSNPDSGSIHADQCLTFFDHHIPDENSFPGLIVKKGKIETHRKEMDSGLSLRIEPYKQVDGTYSEKETKEYQEKV